MGRESAVGIATRYGLDGSGIESVPVQTGSGALLASYTMSTGSFPRVNPVGHGIEHPPPSSAKVKERVMLYLYSTFGPS
jgi:hypothetical protein